MNVFNFRRFLLQAKELQNCIRAFCFVLCNNWDSIYPFQHSFPEVVLWTFLLCFRGLRNSPGCFSHVKYLTIDIDIEIDIAENLSVDLHRTSLGNAVLK